MKTKKEMLLEIVAERLDSLTDEEIEKFTVEIVTKNAEVITSKVDFSVN